nr:uncharacterized protein LOC129166858 [Nothobranchius furzeri]
MLPWCLLPPSRNPSGRVPERSRVGPRRAAGCAGSKHTSQALTLFFTNMSRSRSIKTFADASRRNVKGAAKINKNVTHERNQAGAAPGGLTRQPRVVPVRLGRQSTKPPRMRSGCHEHRCPTTSGGSCCSVCHGCVTALHSHGGMDSGFCFTLGAENYFERLQAPIRLSSSSILRRSVLPRPGDVSSHPSGSNLPVEEGSDMHCASRSVSERFLVQVLPGPETGRDRDSPDPGSEGPEPMPQKVQIQNAHALIPFASDSPERLVHLNRPEGRILSYSRVPSTQEISEVCLSGSVLRIHRAPIRPLAEPEGVCQVYGGSDRPSEREGHSAGHVFRQLAPAGTIQRGGSVKHAGCDPSLVWSGFQNKLAEKRFTPLPENNLSRSESGLRGVHGPSLDTRVNALSLCLARFRLHSSVRFALCLRLVGLMASAISVVPLGRLHMRDFQRWVASLGLSPVRHRARRVTVFAACVVALRCWRHPSLLAQGVPLGLVLVRKVVTTDASLSGWGGGLLDGRSVRGVWSRELWGTHINYLELLAVFLALRRFLPFLSGHHVLVRTDNTTTVAYINHQGGLRSMRLHTLARRLILWCSRHLLSIRATHVPGVLNRGADLLSRGTPLYGDWSLHPAVLEQIWIRFGTAVVDLFASKENAQCPLFFSLRDRDAPLGVDALVHDWPRRLLYAFPPVALIPPTLLRVRIQRHTLILVAPYWPAMHWVADIFQLLEGQPWKLPLRRDLVSQAEGSIFHPHPERLALWAWPLRGAG